MALKEPYRLFFAIPFDSATKEMYSRIREKIRNKYGMTTTIGTNVLTPSPDYKDIASFKAQNTDMISEMRQQIERADIIVADMTHNNPNVHFELGIALYLNKNILKVTGRSLGELGFDVRGLEVYQYRNENQLIKRITQYIEMFREIKDLPLSRKAGYLYRRHDLNKPIEARGDVPSLERVPEFRMRDGAVRAVIKPNLFLTDIDWFGVYFRFEDIPWIGGGYLAYVRKNGSVEITGYPGGKLLKREMLIPPLRNSKKVLEVELEENMMKVSIDGKALVCKELRLQNAGNVAIAAYHSNVTLQTVEVVCRDTLNPI